MIFLSLYFDQFYTHLLNVFPSHHRRFSYDPYDFIIYNQNGFVIWDAN